MAKNIMKTLLAGTVCLSLGVPSSAQTQQVTLDDPDSFTSENAILDTSILFAIGAREARQELRGSFGWPTFQEGLAEGVYFRFDPDGYARFSPSPRLDTDVFEVICRPRTYSCMARKNGLAVALTSRGTLQLRVENVVETDQFFVADGVSELPLPPNILQPLDPRLELLLSSGGELVVKRRDAEADRVSLVGFAAIAAYLRWISARQDYVVLPRGWPIPNSESSVAGIGLTQAASWQSPMPQPLIPQAIPPEVDQTKQAQISQIAETSKEAFELLKEIADPAPARYPSLPEADMSNSHTVMLQLKSSIDALILELQLAHGCQPSDGKMMTMTPDTRLPDEIDNDDQRVEMVSGELAPNSSLAARLEFLIEEIGLPADLAVIVAQQGQDDTLDASNNPDDVVGDILNELRTQLKSENASQEEQSEPADYKLLSEYFRSVAQE